MEALVQPGMVSDTPSDTRNNEEDRSVTPEKDYFIARDGIRYAGTHLIIDLSKSYSELDFVALKSAKDILLITQLDLPCLRNVVRPCNSVMPPTSTAASRCRFSARTANSSSCTLLRSASRFVMASPTAMRPDAGASTLARGARSPELIA